MQMCMQLPFYSSADAYAALECGIVTREKFKLSFIAKLSHNTVEKIDFIANRHILRAQRAKLR